jgi:hypothetical protein
MLLPLAIFTACGDSGSSSTETTASEDGKESFEVLFNDLFLPGSGGVFRGVNFEDSRAAITELETSRKTITVLNDDSDYYVSFTSDMGKEVLNFADIEYSVDDMGMYGVSVETYAIDKETADAILKLTLDYLTDLYGESEVASDGFYEFSSEDDGVIYAVKDIGFEESYGMQIYIDPY